MISAYSYSSLRLIAQQLWLTAAAIATEATTVNFFIILRLFFVCFLFALNHSTLISSTSNTSAE